ncbi:MAG: alpha/beta hydrolase [Bacteroidota bacterium]
MMNIKLKITKGLILFLTLALLSPACSKDEDTTITPDPPTPPAPMGTRYLDTLFTEVTATKEVKYGANTNQSGANTDLLMNIYEPANDTETNRPLIILAHGGGFAEGAKEDFDGLAQKFAKAGYVAATISYRLIGGVADPSLQKAVVDAVQDMKAAVRYFTIDNKFNINPNNIFIGGFSAGAVTALHYAYFQDAEISSAPPELQSYLAASGGLSGNSGNPGASEKVKGVINIAGGLFSANWVSANEPILYSIHGAMDTDVYCDKDPEAQSNPQGDFTEGSCLIHPILDSLGITNQFKKIEGGDHGAYFICSDCDEEMRTFVFNNL